MATDTGSETPLSPEEAERLATIRSASSLGDLRETLGSETDHDAYFDAKEVWQRLRQKELGPPPETEGLPGNCVRIDGQAFHVHGITHADTDAEGTFLRDHVREFLDAGERVYCEQGIRSMYFDDMPDACEIDDYRWAMHHCRERDLDSHIEGLVETAFEEDGMTTDIRTAASEFRETVFSLIDSGSEVYGDRFARALGDLASDFLMDHEHVATGEDFASFDRSRQAARNPAALDELQHYYKTVFLPQPLEREWLRRHDPELELFTHARNERMAEYLLAHADGDTTHLVTGAAHQPGVTYYLEAYRDGDWAFDSFEMVP